MNEELKVLELIANRLSTAGISYMITGSIAMNYYATPRMTRNIDVVINLQREDVGRLIKLFQKDFYIDEQTVLEALEHENMFNIIHNEWIVKADFIIRKSVPYRELELSRRKKVDMGSFEFWIVAPEDLILSKLSWAKESMSDYQLRDVRSLLEGVEGLDRCYVEKWVKNLDLEEPYDKVKL